MSKHVRRGAYLPLLATSLVLVACTQTETTKTVTTSPAPSPAAEPPASSAPISFKTTPPSSAAPTIMRGTGSFVGTPLPQAHPVQSNAEGITLNFVNADVSDVAKAVLGDYLKLNYVVDASVQGAVTLQTSRPLAREDVLPALEAAFRLSGLALLHDSDVYRIVPIAEAPRALGSIRPPAAQGQPGYGVQIVPLRYVGADAMQHMLEPLTPQGSILRADNARNLLVVAGTAQERDAILDNIRLFDVDWMAGMSFALFPLHAADAKSVAAELSEIIGTKDGPMAGIVRLSAIERMNAVLAISPQPKYLETLQGWIDKLDRAQESTDRRLYVYYVQNGRAADLANTLNKVLGAGGSASDKHGGQGDGDISGSSPQLPAVPQPVMSQVSQGPQSTPAASLADAGLNGGGSTGNQNSQSSLKITSDDTNNALLILATPGEHELVENAVKQLDIAPLEVLLEAAVAEVTLTDNLSFGVQYAINAGRNNQVIQTTGSSATISPSLPGFAYIFATNSNIQATLSALQDITHVDVISAPEVLVLNNQAATLQVGDQVPIATQSAVSTETANAPVVNSIEYRDTGVILKVTPRVNEGGLVMMDVAQEVSDVSSTTTSSLDSPTISERKINSTIAVQDGETVALGGLFSESRTREHSGIPVLQDIPYLGSIFSTTSDNHTKTELLVLITPHVVRGVQKLRAVTEELKQQMQDTLPLFPKRN
jgi:general secretion pathway protein D